MGISAAPFGATDAKFIKDQSARGEGTSGKKRPSLAPASSPYALNEPAKTDSDHGSTRSVMVRVVQ